MPKDYNPPPKPDTTKKPYTPPSDHALNLVQKIKDFFKRKSTKER